MPTPKWYSPQIRRDLVTALYHRAKAEGIPMTRLTNRLIEASLSQRHDDHEQITPRVAEEPHKESVPG
jgi:hypothetical protein